MKLNYNVTGESRKQMVAVISQEAGIQPVYTRMPECAFLIGNIKVSRTGELMWDERTDEKLIERIMEALSTAGFSAEEATETHQAEDESTDGATETQGAGAPETTGLIISFPLDGGSNGVAITEKVLENLRKLNASKATLIQKALKADRLIVEKTEERVSFPWWDKLPEQSPEGFIAITAYTEFLTALIRMAKDAKRVTATEKETESEKYTLRTFLLRLGFGGPEHKTVRKELLKPLNGHSAFPTKAAAEKFYERQRGKRHTTEEQRG